MILAIGVVVALVLSAAILAWQCRRGDFDDDEPMSDEWTSWGGKR